MVKNFIWFFCILAIATLNAHAVEKSPDKKTVNKLYKEYKKNLKAGEDRLAFEAALKIYKITPSIYGEKSKIHIAMTLKLANLATKLRNYKEAAKYYQIHFDLAQSLNPPKDINYIYSLSRLGNAYKKIYKHDKAIKNFKIAYSFALDSKAKIKTLAHLELKIGEQYLMSHKTTSVRKASKYLKLALENSIKIYGKDNILEAQALFLIAKIDTSKKRYNIASERLENVLSIYKLRLKEGNVNILQTHAFLVNTYEKSGNSDKATEHCIAVAEERDLSEDMEWTPLFRTQPNYPAGAANNDIEGYMIVEFTVNKSGQVRNIKTLKAKNGKYFKNSVYQAIKNFRYAPSTKNGEIISTDGVQNKIIFRMR